MSIGLGKMRKIGWITFFAVIGSSIGIKVNTITKKQQKKAKAEKKHIPYGPYEAIIKRIFGFLLLLFIIYFLLYKIYFNMLVVLKMRISYGLQK